MAVRGETTVRADNSCYSGRIRYVGRITGRIVFFNIITATRTIVSGIAQHFQPESLVGKQVIVVANLAPRKMRGIESQGMILTAEQPDGKLILVNPDAPTINGSNVK